MDDRIEAAARAAYATYCAIHGTPLNWGRSTKEQPSGFKTEVIVWTAVARAVIKAAPPELLESLKELVSFSGAHGGPYARARALIAEVEGNGG